MRMKRSRRHAGFGIAAVLAFALPMVASATGEEVDRDDVVGGLAFVDLVEVTVVNIDVYVRDRQDRPVTGLTREDFRLIQDGSERTISHFAAYTDEVIDALMAGDPDPGDSETAGPSEAPVAAIGPDSDPSALEQIQPVYIALYVDNENIRPHDRNRVLAQVRRFIREVMRPHVQVMVISAQRSVEIVQPFTNDPRAVSDALLSMNRSYGARVDQDRDRGRIIHDLQQIPLDRGSAGTQQAMAEARELQERIRTYGEELAMELGYSVDSLRGVLTTLAGLQGRKVLVHVSNGLPAVPARDLIDWYGDLYQKSSTLPLLARFNRRYLFDSLASSANSQGITFYTIDATGLGGHAAASAEFSRPVDPNYAGVHALNLQEPLLLLAEKTGGRAIVDSNDVTGLLEELSDDLFTYYSLGHTLPTSGADTVHRITVELPDHPEYDLVYRRTLVEKSPETQVQDTVVSGLMLALDDNPMGLELNAGEARYASEDRWLLPVEVGLPIESVAMLPETDDYVGRVVVFVANRDLKGRQSDLQRRQFEIRMPAADYESRRNERYVAEFDLLLNSGEHRIVIGAFDPVTRQASFASLNRTLKASGAGGR
jgi:VWFA-related protein